MTRRVILRERAQNDLRSAFEWYESQRRGLGEAFLAAVGERLESIAAFPNANPVIWREMRRAVVSRFPYSCFTFPKPSVSTFSRFLHHARNPADWPSR